MKEIYPKLTDISEKKRLYKNKSPLHITILMYIYKYKCAMVISKISYQIILLYK